MKQFKTIKLRQYNQFGCNKYTAIFIIAVIKALARISKQGVHTFTDLTE